MAASLVQTATPQTTGAQVSSISFAAPVTVGNLVVTSIVNNQQFLSPTVTDDAGNTYTRFRSVGNGTFQLSGYYTFATASVTTISFDNSGNGTPVDQIHAYEFSGVTSLDVTGGATATGGDLSATITTTAASDLLIASANTSNSPHAGYTVLSNTTVAGENLTDYFTTAAPLGATTLDWGSGQFVGIAGAFFAATGGGTPVTHLLGMMGCGL